jgi:hypothetical protein
MNEYFPDFVISLIEAGFTAVNENNSATIDSTISALQTEANKVRGDIDYWRDLGRDDLVAELTRLLGLYNEFIILFNVYYRYLIDTNGNGNPPYIDWLEQYNAFLGAEPNSIVTGSKLPTGTITTSTEYKLWQRLQTRLTASGSRQQIPTSPRPPAPTPSPTPSGQTSSTLFGTTSFTGLPLDNSNLCLFHIETREINPGGNRTITLNNKQYSIKNPPYLEFRLWRCCTVDVPKRIDNCGLPASTNPNDIFKADERHIIVNWTRLDVGKLSYSFSNCSNGKGTGLNYKYYYDTNILFEKYHEELRRYNIIIPDGQNSPVCPPDPNKQYPFGNQYRQFISVSAYDHIVSRTIDTTVYGAYPDNRGKALIGAYAPELNGLCTFARNPQYQTPPGQVGEILGSLANKTFVDNFNRPNGLAYTAPAWLKYSNIGIMSSVEAILRGNDSDKNGNQSATDWFDFGIPTSQFRMVTDITEFDNPKVETTSYPYVDPLSSTPNERLFPLVAVVEAVIGGEDGCEGPGITPTGYDCARPFNQLNVGQSNEGGAFNWTSKAVGTSVYRDIPDGTNAFVEQDKRYVALIPHNNFDGSVRIGAGQTFNIFGGGSSVLTFNNFTDTPNVQIPGRPCHVGTQRTYKIDIKRQQKRYIEIECVGWGKVPYFSKPGDVPKAAFDSTFDKGDFNQPSVRGPYAQDIILKTYPGAILEESTGQFYIWENVNTPFLDQNGNRDFVTFLGDTISLNINGVGCQPSREQCAQSEPQVDPNNICGCTEFIIETCDDVYDSFEYTDFMGRKTFVKEYRIAKTFPANPQYNWLRTTERIAGTSFSSRPECNPSPIRMHHPFLFGADVLTGMKKNVVFGLFNGLQSPTCYLTSSVQPSASKEYYYDITDCDSCTTKPYYAIAYGHYEGSGSTSIGYDFSDSATKAIYSQYRLLALEHPETRFKFYDLGTETTPKGIYVINFYRDGLSHRIDPGNFQINLAGLSGSAFANNVHTGSNVQISGSNPTILSLIDNSGDIDDSKFCLEDPYSYYDIVSGSLSNGIHNSGTGSISTNANITTYGRVYPNIGVVVLNGDKFDTDLGFNSVTGSNIAGDNAWKLHTSISGAAALGQPIKARNVRTKTTNHYFVRVPTTEANYSTNPTYVINEGEKRGQLKYECFVNDPVTYITSVGLYNDKQELLAIAKLSRPIQKTPDNDVLIKIRLNW